MLPGAATQLQHGYSKGFPGKTLPVQLLQPRISSCRKPQNLWQNSRSVQQGWEREPGSSHGNWECAGTPRKSWRPKVGILGTRRAKDRENSMDFCGIGKSQGMGSLPAHRGSYTDSSTGIHWESAGSSQVRAAGGQESIPIRIFMECHGLSGKGP